MTQPTQSQTSVYQNLWNGLKTGVQVMVVQAPLLNSWNRVSVIACRDNLSTLKAIQRIFGGAADGVSRYSIWHFGKGIDAHVIKEAARVGFKSSGLLFKPEIDAYFNNSPYGKHKADLALSGALSVAEMAINPADTLRTMWQANEKLSDVKPGTRLSHLYKGSAANGGRQFAVWLVYSKAERRWTEVVGQMTPLDPASLSGIVVKSYPMSLEVTTAAWLFERLKNELQYNRTLTGTGEKTSRYLKSARHVVKTQGITGLARGAIAKFHYYAFLAMGANWMLERAREAQRAKMASTEAGKNGA